VKLFLLLMKQQLKKILKEFMLYVRYITHDSYAISVVPPLTGYEPELVCDNLCKMAPRPPLLVVQVHGERVSPKGHEFELLSVCTLYTCRSVAGQL